MGELHEKYQQRLAETTNVHSTEITNLRTGFDAAVADNNGLMTTLCLMNTFIFANGSKRQTVCKNRQTDRDILVIIIIIIIVINSFWF